MMQSAPSKTALATSLPSARVGRGFLIILSNIYTHAQKERENGVKIVLEDKSLCTGSQRNILVFTKHNEKGHAEQNQISISIL